MTRHLLRLIWNRKRQNFLLTVEIFFSFLTLFGVVLIGMQYANNARHPTGYQIAGPAFSENLILDAAFALEKAIGFDGSGAFA